MHPLEKLLQEASGFLQEVSDLSSEWISDLKVDKSREIIKYHPLQEGHMLRPLLVYITSLSSPNEITEDIRKKLIYFAAAIELMHNASLIHDDLLDQEEFRRGKRCVSKEYGFKNALLAGNIYYIKAIELSNRFMDPTQTKDLLQSAIAMCEGEILQAQYENVALEDTIYDRIIRYKTGCLTALACRQAAEILKEDRKLIDLYGELGEELGVMYQLRDDRKDNDVKNDSSFMYQSSLDSCQSRIQSLRKELSATQKMKQFDKLVGYFLKN